MGHGTFEASTGITERRILRCSAPPNSPFGSPADSAPSAPSRSYNHRVVSADFIIRNTSEILTCAGPAPRRGAAQADASPVPGGVVAALQGRIVFVGPEAEWARAGSLDRSAVEVDARGGAVVPGFVDPHTHAVYAGNRQGELRERLGGATYADIAARGGGIVSTVAATRAASAEELADGLRRRLDEMLRCGTTTCEAKSGYGLTLADELKMLRAIASVASAHPMDIAATFMGAHEVPIEFRGRRAEYVSLICDEMLPAVAREHLAEWCDVFCETGVFSPEESAAILTAAARAGLKLRIHADELGLSGGAGVAAAVGARSADHLIFVDETGADLLAGAGTVATLLPAAAFYLKLGRFAPARLLIGRGVAVALATDVNPGGGFSPSMPFVITLACFGMGLTFEEALVGSTINAAYALDRHADVGSLETGKWLDAVVLNGPAIELIRVGADSIRAVIKRGRVVHGASYVVSGFSRT
jgi:imidazolonepropionase